MLGVITRLLRRSKEPGPEVRFYVAAMRNKIAAEEVIAAAQENATWMEETAIIKSPETRRWSEEGRTYSR